MPSTDVRSVLRGGAFEVLIVPLNSHQTGSRGLVESKPEPALRDGPDDCLVDVLDALDEMCLTYDDIRVLWDADLDGLQFRFSPPQTNNDALVEISFDIGQRPGF